MLKCVLFLLYIVILADCNVEVTTPVQQEQFIDNHNINICNDSEAKNRLLGTNLFEPEALNSTVKRIVNYPEAGVYQDVITCIRVLNADPSRIGGYPRVISGGVDSTYVQFLFTSEQGEPLNYRIEIWSA